MTTIKTERLYSDPTVDSPVWIIVNGRKVLISSRIESIEKVSSGEWKGTTRNGWSFEIFGGRKAGGSSRDWFVTMSMWVEGAKPIDCTSAVDAIKMIENC